MTILPSELPPGEAITAEEFKAEVASWARQLGVVPREVRLRPLRRKWGSCSSQGRLTFDTGLLRERSQRRAEVIVHELLHLRIPNHGPVFRSLLRAYLGESTP